MMSRRATLCILTLPLLGVIAPVRAAQPDAAYPRATRRVVSRALIQKVVQLEVQYDMDEVTYGPASPVQQSVVVSLRALRARLTQLRPDGYRPEVTKAVRHALITRIAAQEVEVALQDNSRVRQGQAETQLLNLRRHLATLPQAPYSEDRQIAQR